MRGVVERKPPQGRVGEEERETSRPGAGRQVSRSVQTLQEIQVLLLAPVVRVKLPQNRRPEWPAAPTFEEVELILHLQAPVLLRPDLPDVAAVHRDPYRPQTGPLPHNPHDRGGRHSGLEFLHVHGMPLSPVQAFRHSGVQAFRSGNVKGRAVLVDPERPHA